MSNYFSYNLNKQLNSDTDKNNNDKLNAPLNSESDDNNKKTEKKNNTFAYYDPYKNKVNVITPLSNINPYMNTSMINNVNPFMTGPLNIGNGINPYIMLPKNTAEDYDIPIMSNSFTYNVAPQLSSSKINILPNNMGLLENTFYNPLKDSLFANYNLGTNTINAGFYTDLNKDDKVHKTITKHYYYKLIEKWIYKDMNSLLDYIKIVDGKPMLIRSLNEKNHSVNEGDINKKVKYFTDELISKNMIYSALKRIIKTNDYNWYDLNKHEKEIKHILKDYIKNTIEKGIKNH